MKSLLEQLKDYFNNTPRAVVEAEWAKLSCYDDIGPAVEDFLSDWSYDWANYPRETVNAQKTPDVYSEFFIFA